MRAKPPPYSNKPEFFTYPLRELFPRERDPFPQQSDIFEALGAQAETAAIPSSPETAAPIADPDLRP